MFINLSNHPLSKWSESQIGAAEVLGGEIIDYPFPAIRPEWSSDDVRKEAEKVFNGIVAKYGTEDLIVHVVGEFTFTYLIVTMFKQKGIRCCASCTERIAVDNPDGTKTSGFDFVQFRLY